MWMRTILLACHTSLLVAMPPASCQSLVQLAKVKSSLPTSAGNCIPSANRIWLWEVFHKTGTELSKKILDSGPHFPISVDGVDMDPWDYGVTNPSNPTSYYRWFYPTACRNEGGVLSKKCLELANATTLRTIYGTSITPISSDMQVKELKDQLVGFSEELGLSVALISWIRDPLKVLSSAYPYHLSTSDETWLFSKPSEHVMGFFDACDKPEHVSSLPAHESPRPAAEACSAASQAIPPGLREKTTYRELLANLTMEQGSLVESWNSYSEMVSISQRFVLYQHLPDDMAFTVFLDDIMANCTEGFQKIWSKLGVDKADLDSCIQTGCSWVDEGKTDPHATSSQDTSEDLKGNVQDFLLSSDWFAEHVQPLRDRMNL